MLVDTSKHQFLSKAFTLRPAISNDQFWDMKDEDAQNGEPNRDLCPLYSGLDYAVYKLPNIRLYWVS